MVALPIGKGEQKRPLCAIASEHHSVAPGTKPYPAILTSLQNAGRCIRSEKDKGVIVFLDERYDWPNYKKILQNEDIIVTKGYLHEINKFFQN